MLTALLAEAQERLRQGQCIIPEEAVRVFWVNPVADLRAMNLLEEWGGRICGSDYMFGHALDLIPEDLPPLEALARTALADPMVGSTLDRARRIVADCRAYRAEAVVVSRIPGASHCAREGAIIRQFVREELGLPSHRAGNPAHLRRHAADAQLARAGIAGNSQSQEIGLSQAGRCYSGRRCCRRRLRRADTSQAALFQRRRYKHQEGLNWLGIWAKRFGDG